jgi:PAS domain S-box-containing protein
MNAASCDKPPGTTPATDFHREICPSLNLKGAASNEPVSPRILIIDDTRAIHNDFRKILMPIENTALDEATAALFGSPVAGRPHSNFVVDSAYQGNEGLALVQCALLEGRPYAVAFLDVRMPPGWDGVETAEKLWAADPDLQIVLCSAYADYSWDDIVRRLQATDSLVILKKPFDNAEVLQLAHALEKKWRLTRQSKSRLADLDSMVHQRTEELQRRAEMENIVSTLSTQFIGVASADLEESIRNALKVIATFAGADYGFMFGAATGGRRDHHLEWHAEDVVPLSPGLEEVYSDPSGWWMQKLGRLENILIPKFDELPAEAAVERAFGKSLDLRSLAVVPLVHGKLLLGFAGLASVRAERNWRDENMALLKIVGEIFANTLQRRQSELRLSAFSGLGLRLSAAQSAREATRIIVDVAYQLLGWDACFCDLFSPDERVQAQVLNMDTINGQRVECASAVVGGEPAPNTRKALEQGGHLILREKPELPAPGIAVFGDTQRTSASLMFVPIRNGTTAIGVLSIQSYTSNAYDQRSLETLQTLADHCGGALERLRVQEALKDSEANYRSLVERSPDAIFVQREGRFVYANSATLKLLQTEKPQLIGRQVLDFVQPAHRELVAERIEQVAQGRSEPLLEQQILRPDGSGLDVEATSIPFTYESQPAVQTVMRDISKRKQVELRLSALSALGHRLSKAQSAKAAAQIVVEVADRLIGWDSCLCDLYSAVEDTWSHMLNIDIINGQRAECPPVIKSGQPSALARRAMTEGGQLVLRSPGEGVPPGSLPFGDKTRPSASLLYVPIRNDTNVIGLLSIQSYRPNAYDQYSLELLQALADHCGGALDRIRGQEALLKAEERLHHVLAQSPAVLYSLKPDGQDFKLAWISENVTQLLGFSPEEACQADWRPMHLHAADHQQMKTARDALFREHRGAVEYRFRHKNGSYRWLRDEQRLICAADGQPAEIIGTSMDITERKELEELLRQSQKMEAIGQLAGGVAHDFNNLLAVIRGNTELLLLKPGRFAAEESDCLKQVVAASERAAGLTRQLLAFGRKQMMQLQPLNLNDIVGNLTKMLKRIIGENIQLQCTYASRLPMVQADVGMLEQVIVNLVVNARDAMPEGGQLLLTTQVIHFAETSPPHHPEARAGEFVSLTVTDTGTGIATEHLSRIFEPFFTTKEVGKGTGLGLATVYGIVKQHQGWVEVASRLGKGSTFRVFLPAVQQPSTALGEPAPREEKLRGGTETILVVEDDDAVRSLTRRVLENFGYRVRDAASGREALEVCRDHLAEIDLVLTDLIMPHGVSGRDLAEQLLTRRPALKALFMSGYSSEAIGPETQFIQQLKARLLQKPCPWRDLLRAVRESLDTEVLLK